MAKLRLRHKVTAPNTNLVIEVRGEDDCGDYHVIPVMDDVADEDGTYFTDSLPDARESAVFMFNEMVGK